MDTVVNRTCHSINEESLEIMSTVPLEINPIEMSKDVS